MNQCQSHRRAAAVFAAASASSSVNPAIEAGWSSAAEWEAIPDDGLPRYPGSKPFE